MKADFDDLESLKTAFKGADAVFAVTGEAIDCTVPEGQGRTQEISVVGKGRA